MTDYNYNALDHMRKLARKGWRKPPESKYNAFRAQWLKWAIKQTKWDTDYFYKEYKNMPDYLKAEGKVVA